MLDFIWGWNNGQLDSNDFKSGKKKGAPAGVQQRAIVHEFGHMIGFPDEYKKSSKHYKDSSSIMHSGEALRQRHRAPFRKYVDAVTPLLKI